MSSFCDAPKQPAYTTGRLACEDNRLLRPGGLELTARAIALARLGAGASVLDLGCGAGDSVRYLCTLGLDAIGIDGTSDERNRPTRALDPAVHIVARAEELPFPQNSVHGVLAECSLSLIEDQERVLLECARVLKDGGCLMISDLYARQPEGIAAVRALTGSCISGIIVREELETILTRCGFSVEIWEDHSLALRESAARYILQNSSLEGLWTCTAEGSTDVIQAAMRTARAGYFLLIAARNRRNPPERADR
jgi:ubiquinone/menaquinone biosynthesis C-methylase UbiE